MTTFAAAPAATTTTAVKVGKGLAIHQGSGFENYPICGTTRALTTRYSAYKTGTEVEVTCLKCLREMEGNRVAAETAAAQAARNAEIEAEEAPAEPIVITEEMVAQADADMVAHNEAVAAQAARSAAVGEWLDGSINAFREAAQDLPKVGATLRYKDGLDYTFISLSKDGKCYRVASAEGKRTYKPISKFL